MKEAQPNENNPGGRSSATSHLKIETSQTDSTSPGFKMGIRRSSSLQFRDVGRRAPAHFPPLEQDARSIIIYLTICTQRRRPLLANHAAGRLLIDAPASIPTHRLKAWIGFWKNLVTCGWPRRDEIPIWQPDYWDRQLRREESYAEKWDYVVNNPVRRGLVKHAEDWPYQGELNILEWHD